MLVVKEEDRYHWSDVFSKFQKILSKNNNEEVSFKEVESERAGLLVYDYISNQIQDLISYTQLTPFIIVKLLRVRLTLINVYVLVLKDLENEIQTKFSKEKSPVLLKIKQSVEQDLIQAKSFYCSESRHKYLTEANQFLKLNLDDCLQNDRDTLRKIYLTNIEKLIGLLKDFIKEKSGEKEVQKILLLALLFKEFRSDPFFKQSQNRLDPIDKLIKEKTFAELLQTLI